MGSQVEIINEAREYYKKENGVDIEYLGYADQGFLVDVFIHGAEGVVKRLLSEARVKQQEAEDEAFNLFSD